MAELEFDTSSNTSFSQKLNGMQLAIDSTSLGEAKTCPKRYFYAIVCGYQPRGESAHLTFGLLMHSAREIYSHSRLDGMSHDDALDATLDWALKATWNKELKRGWISDEPTKTRVTLIRTIIWYFDLFGADDPLATVTLANNKPAVELSFRFDSGLKANTGEMITFCGHMDRLVISPDGDPYVSDMKTTKQTISASWFQKWSPNNQFSLYSLAGKVVYNVETKGLIVDGIQVAVGFSRFQRGLVPRKKDQIEEWYVDATYWIGQMNYWAQEQFWPQNDKSCDLYGGCPFRPVCARPKGARRQWLELDYKKRVWDPLQRRGDI